MGTLGGRPRADWRARPRMDLLAVPPVQNHRECRRRRRGPRRLRSQALTMRWPAVSTVMAGVTRAAGAAVAINAATDGGTLADHAEPVPASSRGGRVVAVARREATLLSEWSPLNLPRRLRRRARAVTIPMEGASVTRGVHRAISVVMARGKRGAAVARVLAQTLGVSGAASRQVKHRPRASRASCSELALGI